MSTGVLRAEEPGTSSGKTSKKADEKPVRKLKGEFKGHPIAAPPDAEAERKIDEPKTTTKKPPPTLVIDNAMIQKEPGHATAKAAEPRSSPPPIAASPPPPAAVTFGAPVDLNGNGEKFWREKAKGIRDRLAQAQQNLESAQLEEKREENDFYAWDDGQYRDNVIKPAWDHSKEETARAQEELAAAQKASDELEDDARKAGAFPGWLRE
ncbi:MAG: hypothetical protein ACRD16_12440 [Thermoanaerobaculia bacterium]